MNGGKLMYDTDDHTGVKRKGYVRIRRELIRPMRISYARVGGLLGKNEDEDDERHEKE